MRWSWLDEMYLVLIHEEPMLIPSLESHKHSIEPREEFRSSVDDRGFPMKTRSRSMKKGAKMSKPNADPSDGEIERRFRSRQG